MKLFRDVAIGETFVVAGGFTLVKTSEHTAKFPDAENVGDIPHSETMETYTEEEFNSLLKEPSVEVFKI